MNTVSGRMSVGDPGRCDGPRRAGDTTATASPVRRAEPLGEPRVQLHERPGRGGVELVRPAGSARRTGTAPRTRPVVSSTRVLVVRLLGGRPVGDGDEPGPAVRGGEPVEEEPRGARGAPGSPGRARTRRLLGEPLVGDARVVGGAARAGPAQLLEDLLRVGREALLHAEAGGESVQHLQVAADALRRGERAPAEQHPALQVGHRAGLLGPLGDRQDDVRERRRSRRGRRRATARKSSDRRRSSTCAARGRGHHRVRAHQQQGA